ncbi:hypothetical protein NLG97_g4930 [Lecanicillium saksenae]|uniref:Uncharacterized protein n=1 Tax=Lecanicillium saksenae TaxID=468837 RepID=A0ACC1QV40_9HYPO|nr:hypothetical protein NLG97_g4930 [Lecanicillium saksenae]
MQITAVAVFMAAVVAAEPMDDPDAHFNTNYVPNVSSILLQHAMVCDLFPEHQCKGVGFDGGIIPENRCIDTSKGGWKNAVSFRCYMGHT